LKFLPADEPGLGGGARPSARCQALCGLAGIKPTLDRNQRFDPVTWNGLGSEPSRGRYFRIMVSGNSEIQTPEIQTPTKSSAIGYRRQGVISAGSGGGGHSVTMAAVSPKFDSGTNDGTDEISVSSRRIERRNQCQFKTKSVSVHIPMTKVLISLQLNGHHFYSCN
jgi:hypothetical protein